MVNTRIIEIISRNGMTEEVELGFCQFPVLPVEKKSPIAAKPDDMPPPPMVIRVNDAAMFVIGHSWEIQTDDTEATFVLIVQKIPERSTIVTPSDLGALDKLRHLALDLKKN